ncbi:hypothetical protein ABN034_29725 [Actinopolymorpha sp. B11F2]|uniref:hypothetical protein n=1 Tax=Actinopolymorpha sp. B11F2 TaxID=3160862 RepID=UPI0032E407EF
MGALRDPGRLLVAWEDAAGAPPVARGTVLVHRAGLVDDVDTALDLPIGAVASLAARLYAEEFGAVVSGILTCHSCEQRLDVELPMDSVVAASQDESVGAESAVALSGGRRLLVRAPTTRDLVAAGGSHDPARELLNRCVRAEDNAPVDADGLDDAALTLVDAAAEELAGSAAVVVRTACPSCGTEVAAPLDVAALLWDRVAYAAPAILAEVAELAAAFGWAEAEVLALTPVRRRTYLELARGGAR